MLVTRSLTSASSACRKLAATQSKRSLFFGANPRIRPFSALPGEENEAITDEYAPGMEDLKVAYAREALPVTFSDISRANVAIRSGVKRTTCEKSYFLSELIGANVFLKTEFRQFTGSFK